MAKDFKTGLVIGATYAVTGQIAKPSNVTANVKNIGIPIDTRFSTSFEDLESMPSEMRYPGLFTVCDGKIYICDNDLNFNPYLLDTTGGKLDPSLLPSYVDDVIEGELVDVYLADSSGETTVYHELNKQAFLELSIDDKNSLYSGTVFIEGAYDLNSLYKKNADNTYTNFLNLGISQSVTPSTGIIYVGLTHEDKIIFELGGSLKTCTYETLTESGHTTTDEEGDTPTNDITIYKIEDSDSNVYYTLDLEIGSLIYDNTSYNSETLTLTVANSISKIDASKLSIIPEDGPHAYRWSGSAFIEVVSQSVSAISPDQINDLFTQ